MGIGDLNDWADRVLKGEEGPPPGFSPIPFSKKGGWRKPRPGGGFDYWYPPGETPPPAELVPEDPSKYFTHPPGSRMFNLTDLVATRARPEGIANAEKFLRRAYDGKFPRRAPISVYPNGDGTYSVADGNSTLTTARAHGWKRIPAVVVAPPAKEQKHG